MNMLLDYITWNVSPQIIEGFTVRWYGVLFALAFVSGYYIMGHIFKKEKIEASVLDKLTLYMLIGVIGGARLGHCLFYQPDYYLANPIEILYIWQGGLASHGSAIGIILSLVFFSRKIKKPVLWILDRIVIVVALAGFYIRLGNLMNSEIYGKATDVPWAFDFVREGTGPVHPTQLYEALVCIILFALLFYLYKKNAGKPAPGLLFGSFMVLLFTARFFVEFLKHDQVDFEAGMAINMGQILSIPFVIAGLYLLIKTKKQKTLS